jgi:ferredoxin-type protein NapF
MTLDRADLIRGRFRRPSPRMRPPWAVAGFLDHCSRCDACADICPQRVVVRGDGGYPELRPAEAGCTFCGACVEACPTGALDRAHGQPWPWRAAVGQSCLEARGIACRLCEDACEVAAIRFRPSRGGRSRVVIDQGQCTGCGACLGRCPEDAIVMRELVA